MSDIDRGPLDVYEIIWKSGLVERIEAHQVTFPMPDLFGDLGGGSQKNEATVKIHGEINGRWKLILSAPESDILSIRLITKDEEVPVE